MSSVMSLLDIFKVNFHRIRRNTTFSGKKEPLKNKFRYVGI